MDQIAENLANKPRPKIAETVIEPTVRLREVTVGKCCEILGDTAVEYAWWATPKSENFAR